MDTRIFYLGNASGGPENTGDATRPGEGALWPERARGFGPPIFSLARRRSTTEPRPHCGNRFRGGAETQDRTGDTAIFSRVLYQLSYLGAKPRQNWGKPAEGGGILPGGHVIVKENRIFGE